MTEPSPQAVAETIADQIPDLDANQVASVIQVWNAIRDGDPVGTVRRGPQGELAHRVDVAGVQLWMVTTPSGGEYRDLTPTLSWPVVLEP